MKIKFEYLLWIALLLLIAIGIYSLNVIKSDGSKCLADPVKYTVDSFASQTIDGEVFCTCSTQYKTITFGTDGKNEIVFKK